MGDHLWASWRANNGRTQEMLGRLQIAGKPIVAWYRVPCLGLARKLHLPCNVDNRWTHLAGCGQQLPSRGNGHNFPITLVCLWEYADCNSVSG